MNSSGACLTLRWPRAPVAPATPRTVCGPTSGPSGHARRWGLDGAFVRFTKTDLPDGIRLWVYGEGDLARVNEFIAAPRGYHPRLEVLRLSGVASHNATRYVSPRRSAAVCAGV